MPKFAFSRALPYEPEQVFDVAADVERYPEFLSGWSAAEIVRREGNIYLTDQTLVIGPVRQRFRTRTALMRPDAIDVTAIDGPFTEFQLNWSFKPYRTRHCEVELAGTIDLRARLLRSLFGRVLANGFEDMLAAFEDRVHRIYSQPPPDKFVGEA